MIDKLLQFLSFLSFSVPLNTPFAGAPKCSFCMLLRNIAFACIPLIIIVKLPSCRGQQFGRLTCLCVNKLTHELVNENSLLKRVA